MTTNPHPMYSHSSVNDSQESMVTSPHITREIALAQAAYQHACYFLELGASDRAAAYFQFAATRLQAVSISLVSEQVYTLVTSSTPST